nr:proline-, glutamic acid- and leucine-rich protein 1 [Anolis sagrei ordinatus]
MELAVLILGDLLQFSCQMPDLAREIGTNHIPGLLTSLLALKPQCQLSALEGSKACMTFYPRACGSLRGKLAAYFLSCVDAEVPRLQQLACECYALLPSLGAGFTQGLKYTECWEQQAHCLLATLHSLLGTLYEGAETDPLPYEGPGVEMGLPPSEDGETGFLLQLRQRFSGLLRCLCHMLSKEFVAPVTVPVQDILDLICRALDISTKNISWFGDGPLRMLFLPSIHLEALDLLAALILACGPRLVRFGGPLRRLFPQVLGTWSAGRDLFPAGQERPYSAVRTRLYQVLDLWVQVAGASSGVLQGQQRTPSDEALLGHLLSDISPPTETLKMREGRPPSDGKPSAPKKPKLSSSSSEVGGLGGPIHQKHDPGANSSVCLAALQVLSRAVLLSGSLIKEQTHKRLQELVVVLLVRLGQQAESPPGSPFSTAACRRELYRLLLALALAPAPSAPAPLHCALRLLSQGRADPNLQVSSFCAEALTVCNALLHPRVPSLQLPLPGPPGPLLNGSSEASPSAASPSPFRPAPPLSFAAPRFPPTLPPMAVAAASSPSASAAPPPSLGLLPLAGLPPSVAPLAPPRLTPEEPPLLPPSPSTAAEVAALAAGAKLRRSVFVHYDKEEEEDVEISLDSDSDDSVVIVPKGQPGRAPNGTLAASSGPPPLLPPAAPPPLPLPPPPLPTGPSSSASPPSLAQEEGPPEPPLAPLPPVVVPAPLPAAAAAAALSAVPPASSLSAPPPSVAMMLPPSPAAAAASSEPPLPALVEEDPTVININSSEEDEEDEEDFAEEDYFEEEEEDEEEDEEFDEEEGEFEGMDDEMDDEELEELDEEDEEDFDEEEEGLTEEEEGLTGDEEEEEEEGGMMPALRQRSEEEEEEEEEGEREEPPELLPGKEEPPKLVLRGEEEEEEEEEGGGAGLLMEVEEEAFRPNQGSGEEGREEEEEEEEAVVAAGTEKPAVRKEEEEEEEEEEDVQLAKAEESSPAAVPEVSVVPSPSKEKDEEGPGKQEGAPAPEREGEEEEKEEEEEAVAGSSRGPGGGGGGEGGQETRRAKREAEKPLTAPKEDVREVKEREEKEEEEEEVSA